MADDLDFGGTSHWDDAVSFSKNNSSSSSLDKDHKDSAAAPSTDVVAPPSGHSTASSTNKPTVSTQAPPQTSPSKRTRTSFRPARNRKIVPAAQFENVSEDPLALLGAGDSEATDNLDSEQASTAKPKEPTAPSTSSTNDNGLQDVPLAQEINRLSLGDHSSSIASTRLGSIGGSEISHDIRTGGAATGPGSESVPSSASTTNQDQFSITVGDPIKVGDITSAHTVYTVHTRTNSPNFSKPETSVTRRYRDFRWIFHALENNNPGVIVPPPPEKQAVGRFNEDFVESRRAALENMLSKIARHPILQHDPDFCLFLDSETFAVDVKSTSHPADNPTAAAIESKGLITSIGNAFSFSGKFIESSQWFIDKKSYVDTLEAQLKSLAKALDLVVTQRKELSDATGEFSAVLERLAQVEISKSLSEIVESFSQTEQRIRDLYYRQCLQDVVSLSRTLDEYLRLINSIRSVFAQRQRLYFASQTLDQELSKKRQNLEKVLRQGKSQQDKIAVIQQDVQNQEQKVVNSKVAFDDVSRLIMTEFDRFEHERIQDFRNSVELFLENAVEAQKEAIEVWETFYQLAGFTQV